MCSNSNNKIVHNSIEQFLCNLSDFVSDDVLSCTWIVFTNSVFQVPPQKIVRRVEILGTWWPGVIGLTWNECVSWEVMIYIIVILPRHCSISFNTHYLPSFFLLLLLLSLLWNHHDYCFIIAIFYHYYCHYYYIIFVLLFLVLLQEYYYNHYY